PRPSRTAGQGRCSRAAPRPDSRRARGDRRLGALRAERVELLVDVRVVPDQVTRPADSLGKLVAEDDHAEALARLVPDPFARRHDHRQGLAQLVEGRLRVDETPDEDADDHAATDWSFWSSS